MKLDHSDTKYYKADASQWRKEFMVEYSFHSVRSATSRPATNSGVNMCSRTSVIDIPLIPWRTELSEDMRSRVLSLSRHIS